MPTPDNTDITIRIHMLSNIPYDIFLIIAFLCWNDGEDKYSSNFPIIASHVCRIWRRYALDTGVFWATLGFRKANIHPALIKYTVWLERARGSPLDIFIEPQPFKTASVKNAKAIMRLIMPHVSHWRSFRVDRVPKKISRLIFDRLRDVSAPMLESLTAVGERARRHFQPPTTTRCKIRPFVHGDAPNLMELAVVGFPHDYFLTRFTKLRVLQLTQFEFSQAGQMENVKSIQRVLLCLPNLHTLHIHCDGMSGDHHRFPNQVPPLPRISHPSLTELWIRLPEDSHDAILSCLDLPRARYFLSLAQLEAAVRPHLLLPLSQHHPFPNLVSLRLPGNYSPSSGGWMGYSGEEELTHLEGALSGLPLLKALTFERVNFVGGRWLLCLGTTCPRLQWLTLIQCGGCTPEQIRAVVEARQKRPGFDALARLAIEKRATETPTTVDKDAEEWLRRSLIYKSDSMTDDLKRDTYLSVVEGLKPTFLLTGINKTTTRRPFPMSDAPGLHVG
ncbi:hypothetical protein FRC01_008622 [Tulasnella sp. 417]|nr:hypothetical protein FRC01_008622 [Tulasnella sp. 417]